MSRERFNHVRLDGGMSQKARQKVVHSFTKASSKPMILLASLKAGGVGLNLCVCPTSDVLLAFR